MVPLMGLSCALMALPFVFRAVNAGKGRDGWVGFGGFTIQPSELVKIVYLFVLSYLLSRRRHCDGHDLHRPDAGLSGIAARPGHSGHLRRRRAWCCCTPPPPAFC